MQWILNSVPNKSLILSGIHLTFSDLCLLEALSPALCTKGFPGQQSDELTNSVYCLPAITPDKISNARYLQSDSTFYVNYLYMDSKL